MSEPKPEASIYRWRPWKIALCALAGLLVAAGGVMALAGSGGEPEAHPLGGGAAPGATGFLPGSIPEPSVPSTEVPVEEDGGIAWSPVLLKGGLSFFVAFAVGYAFRMFLRIGLFFVGVWAASLFLLASAGWVEVHWEVVDAVFQNWAAGLGEQFRSASAFLTGSLPSAGLAGLGLVTGLRRR